MEEQNQSTQEIVQLDSVGSRFRWGKFIEKNFLALAILVTGMMISGSLLYSNGIGSKSGLAQIKQDPQGNVRVDVSADDDPSLGNKNAKVTMVEFSDYQCPFCSKFFLETLTQLDKDYIKTGKVNLVFKDFPLDFHEKAQKAAEAARCVGEQINDVGYYKMHDKLFSNQDNLSIENYKKWARGLDVDGKKFDTCLDSGKYESVVKADLEYGQQLGISGTPAFFINGKLVEGAQPYSVFKEIIDSELNTN